MEALQFPSHINALAISPDSRYIAAGCADGCIYVSQLDERDQTKHQKLVGHAGAVLCVTWSGDGRRIASGGEDRCVQIWDTTSGVSIAGHLYFDDEVTKVQWAPSGRKFLVVSGTCVVIMKEEISRKAARQAHVKSGRASMLRGEQSLRLERSTLYHEHRVTDAEWSSDGDYIATASTDLTVAIYDDHDEEWVLALHEALDTRRIKWSHDGKRIAVGTRQGDVSVYRPAGGSLVQQFQVANAPVRDLSWLAGTLQASSDLFCSLVGANGTAFPFNAPHPVASFSPDGTILAGGSDDRVQIYFIGKGKSV